MSVKITAEKLKQWRRGADGFLQWVNDMRPRIPSSRGGFEVFNPVDFQREIIYQALAELEPGKWRYQTIAISLPRRHSKTLMMSLLVLWRFTTNTAQNIKVVANSERQTLSTGFKLIKQAILNTPPILEFIGETNILERLIRYPKLQSVIEAVPNAVAGLYGEKISCAWVTELHAAMNTDVLDVLASSLGDSENSWLLIDSTVDAQGGPLHVLENLYKSGEDPTVFVYRLEYADLDEALEKSPPWINRNWLKSRFKQTLPAYFQSQHLNQRGAAGNNLFAMADIERAKDDLPHPMTKEALDEYAHGRAYVVGGGLDRAYFGSIHGDATIWTSVAKIAGVDGAEPEYIVLNQQNILGSFATLIKKEIVKDNERYGLKNTTIESYNAQDIATWAAEMKYPVEIVHAHTVNQIPAFMELYRIVKEGRLKFDKSLDKLAGEMETFVYELKGDKPKFGSDKHHDDRVYSLAWAVYSLRDDELASYELDSISCHSRSNHAPLCYLRTGDMILPCANECVSQKKVEMMFNQHRSNRVESELTLPEFYHAMVKLTGGKVYQAI